MPRRNRPNSSPQHGKPGKQSRRPRGWHRSYHSKNVRKAAAWLKEAA